MSSLDGAEIPFVNIPDYRDQLSCTQAWENFLTYNGCSTSKCFWSPENFVPGGEQVMATCLLIVCSSSQVAAAETAPMSIFSAYWASKGFMDLMQMTAVPSTSSGATTSTASSSPTPSTSRALSSGTLASASGNANSLTGSSSSASLSPLTSRRSGLSSGASSAIGAVAVLVVIAIAAGILYIHAQEEEKDRKPTRLPHTKK